MTATTARDARERSEAAVSRAVRAAADHVYRHSNYSPDPYGDAYDAAFNTARALGAGRARARELAEQAARGSDDRRGVADSERAA